MANSERLPTGRERGTDLYRELAGVTSKESSRNGRGRYETDAISMSWLKIKNPQCS
jgi:hypothetical protein